MATKCDVSIPVTTISNAEFPTNIKDRIAARAGSGVQKLMSQTSLFHLRVYMVLYSLVI